MDYMRYAMNGAAVAAVQVTQHDIHIHALVVFHFADTWRTLFRFAIESHSDLRTYVC